MKYPKYTTTVIGAYSVPDWYEALDRLVAVGHRRTHNRHSPPNAMLNYFWQKILAFQGSTRPKPITPYDPNVYHPAAACRARIVDNIDLGLVDKFKMVSSLTDRPVKITMTGPHILARVAYDEYYNGITKMMDDYGKLLRHNFIILAGAGRKHIQIDEPLSWRMTTKSAPRLTCYQYGDPGPAERHSYLDARLSGQLRGRQGVRRTDWPSLF
jgi:5-methyltetrahydropteroyltriglutamate--homocysteine methyltransferase